MNKWGWYEELYKNKLFCTKVKETYQKRYRPLLIDIKNNRIENYCKRLEKAYMMNYMRWEGILNVEWGEHYKTIEEHSQALRQFVKDRIVFLDAVWINEQPRYRVYAYSTEPKYSRFYTSVIDGNMSEKLPQLDCEGYTFQGWYEKENGKRYEENVKLIGDKVYVAKWEKSENTRGLWHKLKQNLEDKKEIVFALVFSFIGIIICIFCYKKSV